ncbi:DgyrCDS3405 [Dimorphilus gyrociliatus]|uniref:DgyrCDS3405 n=1 Tax=Dimorphilus gyrociliatus TaxID=2664684 RepID=A0A7I8VD37_9ANNE|nr:DgyrCDS3405 [Dimorphilus gyrociliatus]
MEDHAYDDLKESRELDIDFHLLMLLCKTRMNSYRNAIFNHGVFKDKLVADVGSGTGILAIWCAQAGARKVYAIEPNSNNDMIEKAAKKNNLENKIVVIKSNAQSAILPEKVDIIISETMDGLMFPSEGEISIAPIADKYYYEGREQFILNFEHIYGVDFTHLLERFRKTASSKAYVKSLPLEGLRAKPAVIDTIDFKTIKVEDCMSIRGNISFKPEIDSVFHGFGIWFKAKFPTGEELDTGPIDHPTHWRQVICFIDKPINLRRKVELKGDVAITLDEKMRYQNLIIDVDLNEEEKKLVKKSWEIMYKNGQHIVSPSFEILP